MSHLESFNGIVSEHMSFDLVLSIESSITLGTPIWEFVGMDEHVQAQVVHTP